MKSSSERRPLARTDDLLSERVGSELVVYDAREKEAHCLSPVAAAVFELADGRRSTSELVADAASHLSGPIQEADVEQALAELKRLDLVAVEPRGDGMSRRHMIRRTAAVGSAAVAASFVTTLGSTAMAQGTGTCAGACPSGGAGNTFCANLGGAGCTCGGSPRVCN